MKQDSRGSTEKSQRKSLKLVAASATFAAVFAIFAVKSFLLATSPNADYFSKS
jgi:hypothetical protein